ncbi:hypothetical protein PAPYR_10312 [Paratrimastix pyriformis]|uniref:F-box domain-containing protein n=1 Tax=Paratrimastix pyriformis TaxID=342808 RepID=A0ABQ8UC04_9EUKA|nr:hypothetical protein PAPYR_10312 [Paratrimastix pyriformis]
MKTTKTTKTKKVPKEAPAPAVIAPKCDVHPVPAPPPDVRPKVLEPVDPQAHLLMEIIPPEILSVICGFLSPLDVANVSQACRTFFQVAWKSEYVWHQNALRMDLVTNPEGKPWMTIVRDGRYRFLPRPEVTISPDGKTVTFPDTTSYTVLVHPPIRSGVWRATFQFEPHANAGDVAIGWSSVPTLPANYLGNDSTSIDWNACGSVYGSSASDHTASGWTTGDEVAIELDMNLHRARLLKNGEEAGKATFPDDWNECWFGACGHYEDLKCRLCSLREI